MILFLIRKTSISFFDKNGPSFELKDLVGSNLLIFGFGGEIYPVFQGEKYYSNEFCE